MKGEEIMSNYISDDIEYTKGYIAGHIEHVKREYHELTGIGKEEYKASIVDRYIRHCGLQQLLSIYKFPDCVCKKLQELCNNYVGENFDDNDLKVDAKIVNECLKKGYNFIENSIYNEKMDVFTSNIYYMFDWATTMITEEYEEY